MSAPTLAETELERRRDGFVGEVIVPAHPGYDEAARPKSENVVAIGGTVPLWAWIGDDGATTFSY